MKKCFTYVFMLFLLIVLPIKVNAICDNSRKTELQKIAGNVTYGYDYIKENDTFNITITNLNPNIYIDDNGTIYRYSNSNELTIGGYKPGDNIRLYVYDTEYCNASALNILYINLPVKNKYYGTEICSDTQEYNLCQMWTNNNLTEEEMREKIDNYKRIDNVDDKTEQIEAKNYALELLIDIYIKYYFIILPLIIIICVFSIYKLSKKTSL